MNHFLDGFKRFADFEGRATRTQYWMFVLFCLIFYILALVLDSMVGGEIFTVLFMLAIIIPSLSLCARRLHDTGRSGWWQLLVLIPYLGSLILLLFCIIESEPGTNQYGDNPQGVDA